MRLKQFLNEMAQRDLQSLEHIVDDMFRQIGLDVYFTNHFRQRILDNGREARDTDVTPDEIYNAFKKMKMQYGSRLYDARTDPKEFIGILKDISTNLNIPFTIDYDKVHKGLHKLTAMTLMRKKHFVPNANGGRILTVQ